jgi:hypothetical protein
MNKQMFKRKSLTNRNLLKIAIVLIATLFLAVEVFRDLPNLINLLINGKSIFKFMFAVLIAFLSIFAPLISAVFGFPYMKKSWETADNQSLIKPTIVRRFLSYAGLSLLVILLSLNFFLVDIISYASIFPMVIPVCGILWIFIGNVLFAESRPSIRIVTVAVSLCLILSLKYIDLNSRKPFFRDMVKIRVGMDVASVEALMSKYRSFKEENQIIYTLGKIEGSYGGNDFSILRIQMGKIEAIEIHND